jgi:hypothetical protein
MPMWAGRPQQAHHYSDRLLDLRSANISLLKKRLTCDRVL